MLDADDALDTEEALETDDALETDEALDCELALDADPPELSLARATLSVVKAGAAYAPTANAPRRPSARRRESVFSGLSFIFVSNFRSHPGTRSVVRWSQGIAAKLGPRPYTIGLNVTKVFKYKSLVKIPRNGKLRRTAFQSHSISSAAAMRISGAPIASLTRTAFARSFSSARVRAASGSSP